MCVCYTHVYRVFNQWRWHQHVALFSDECSERTQVLYPWTERFQGDFSTDYLFFFFSSQRGRSNISQALSGPNEGVGRGSVRRWVYVSLTFLFFFVCLVRIIAQIWFFRSVLSSPNTSPWLLRHMYPSHPPPPVLLPPIHWTWRKGDQEAPEACDVKETGVICLVEAFGNVRRVATSCCIRKH